MQQVTPSSVQVIANNTQNTSALLGKYEVTFNRAVANSKELFSRVTDAFVDAMKNLAKAICDAAAWAQNKISQMLSPSVSTQDVETDSDEIAIESVLTFIKEAELPDPIIETEETLPEPVVLKKSTWSKTALIGGTLLVTAVGAYVLADRYGVDVRGYASNTFEGAKNATLTAFDSLAGYFTNVTNATTP